MVANKPAEESSIRDQIAPGEPTTHFFYEFLGERGVDPAVMIGNGITLWHERVYCDLTVDNSYLWDLAESIVNQRHPTEVYSWAESMRYSITIGTFVPSKWKSNKPFAYKGLLISAIYFLEAERECHKENAARAWHLIAMAYYHLGLNSTLTSRENAAIAAQRMHAARSEKIRALVLSALEIIKANGTAKSIAQAREQVVELIATKEKEQSREKRPLISDWIAEFDTLVPAGTKGRSSSENKGNFYTRLANMLEDWSLPDGPYPQISEAFSHFRKNRKAGSEGDNSRRATSANVPMDESDFFLRIVHERGDGFVSTTKLRETPPD